MEAQKGTLKPALLAKFLGGSNDLERKQIGVYMVIKK